MIGSATGHKGSNVREIAPSIFTDKLALHFQNNKTIAAPIWADLVKTGCLKEMPPCLQNWWYIRAAAVCRQVYLHPHSSVTELRNRFGAAKDNGNSPKHFCKSGGKIIRAILQQLEAAGYVKKEECGRVITPRGQNQLDTIACEINKSK